MATCERKRFKRQKLCAGDLQNYITLQTRELQPVSIGDFEPEESFSDVGSVWAAVKTVSGTSRFSSVNISEKTTHIFYIRWSSELAGLEVNNNFILMDDRRFKLLDVADNDEQRNFLAIQCEERGSATKDAATA